MVRWDFSGKMTLITGATGALGCIVARQFYEAGATMVLVGRNARLLDELFADLALSGQHLLLGGLDLTQPEDAERMAHAIRERFGKLDCVVNTVGGYKAGTPVHQTPLDDWHLMLNMNLHSAFLVSRAVVPLLLEAGGGALVHIGGRAGLMGFAGAAGYCAAKGALIRLTETLADELKHQGIRVNCILPGTIDTPSNRQARPDADFSRWVRAEAIAQVAMFLCSSASEAIHGSAIPVYGLS